MEEKSILEKELKEFQHRLHETEKKYDIEINAAEWKLKKAKLFNLENEVIIHT